MKEAVKEETKTYYGSIDEIIASGVSETEYADVKGFTPTGPMIRIGSVTAGTMIKWSEGNERGGEEKRNAGIRLVLESLVNKDGHRIGLENMQANILKLRGVRHKEVERIVKDILKLNGMTPKKKDEDEEKND